MNTECEFEVCPATFSNQELCQCTINRLGLKDLLSYADSAAKILKDNGFEGKAEALENRYMKVARMIGMVD